MKFTVNADWVGGLWGRLVTHSLTVLTGAQPVFAQLDPALYSGAPWLRWAGPSVALAVIFLSEWAPQREHDWGDRH